MILVYPFSEKNSVDKYTLNPIFRLRHKEKWVNDIKYDI